MPATTLLTPPLFTPPWTSLAPPYGPSSPSRSPALGRPPSPFPWATHRTPSPSSSPSSRSRSALLTPPASVCGWATDSDSHSLDREEYRPRTPSGFEFLDFGDGLATYPRLRSFEWEIHGAWAPATPLSLTNGGQQAWKRRLGPTEVSYYLGSKGDGVNDMYLHIGFRAKPSLVQPDRIRDIWRELVNRHKLFGCEVEFEDDDEVYFTFALERDLDVVADERLSLLTDTNAQEFVSTYLNGRRTLSDTILAKLVISTPSSSFPRASATTGIQTQAEEETHEYDFFLLTTHFLGDGMALHTCADEFFTLLATHTSPSLATGMETALTLRDEREYVDEWQGEDLALPLESLINTPDSWGRMAWAAAKVDFNRTQARLVGSQTFPRQQATTRHTIVPTVSYPATATAKMLKTCKSNGVSLSQAVFALANIAFIRAGGSKGHEDGAMMLYSALNVRPWLEKMKEDGEAEGAKPDWFHIAIGYYNIILPSFLPSTCSTSATFWNRSRSVKEQTSKVVKSTFLRSRTKLMALERERRSVGFEREAARKEAAKKVKHGLMGLGIVIGEGEGEEEEELVKVVEPPKIVEQKKEEAKVAPSLALLGVSMLGNLDGMYHHKVYTGVELHTLTTGSRQRPGALLLFAYTFCGKFWLSLGYDKLGFKGDLVDRWWADVQQGVDEFLVGA